MTQIGPPCLKLVKGKANPHVVVATIVPKFRLFQNFEDLHTELITILFLWSPKGLFLIKLPRYF